MARGSKAQNERGQREGEGEAEVGNRLADARIAIHTKSIPFVPRRPARDHRHRHRRHRCPPPSPVPPPAPCLFSKLCSQFTSDQVSALRFYANPMPMSCNRRGEPLPLRRIGTEGDFIFRGSFTAVLCFKVTTFLLSSVRFGTRLLACLLARLRALSLPCISLRPLAFPRPRYVVLSRRPLLPATTLSLVTQP